MKRNHIFTIVLALGVLILISQGVIAQTRGAGFVFGGLGAAANGEDAEGLYSLGGGGEAVFGGGVGVRFDLAYQSLFEGDFTDGLGVFSPNVLYEFNFDDETSPYIFVGYTLFFRNGTGNGVNFGVGIRHWFSESFGMRFEFRDEVFLEGGSNLHFLQGRVSFLFR